MAELAGSSDFAADIGTRVYWLAVLVGLLVGIAGGRVSRLWSTDLGPARQPRRRALRRHAGSFGPVDALDRSGRSIAAGSQSAADRMPPGTRAWSRPSMGIAMASPARVAGAPVRARGGRQRRAGDRGRSARPAADALAAHPGGQVRRRRHGAGRGFVLGREGPTVQMGGAAALGIAQPAPVQRKARPRRCSPPAPEPGSPRPSTRRSRVCCSWSRSCGARHPTTSRATTPC